MPTPDFHAWVAEQMQGKLTEAPCTERALVIYLTAKLALGLEIAVKTEVVRLLTAEAVKFRDDEALVLLGT